MDVQGNDQIQDIWGFSENNIYAISGEVFSNDIDMLFHFNGNEWMLLVSGDTFPSGDVLKKPFLTVWGYNINEVYLGGEKLYLKTGIIWLDKGNPIDKFIEKVHGSNSNNIFVVGHFGTIAHFNGLDWRTYDQFFDNETIVNSTLVFKNKIFAVGRNSSIAKIYIGNKF